MNVCKKNVKGDMDNIDEKTDFQSDWQHVLCADSVGGLFGDSRVYLK